MEKTIEELEKELVDMKASNNAAWSLYGSELCAGNMLAEEANLELEIKIAKGIKKSEFEIKKVKWMTNKKIRG